MVVKANEMQHAMDDDAVQLAFVSPTKGHGILLDTIHADAELARKHSFAIRQGEGHNIGIEIVAETLSVNLQQFLVTAKIVMQLPDRLAVSSCHRLNPCLVALRFNGRHLHIQCAESDHLNACFSSSNSR